MLPSLASEKHPAITKRPNNLSFRGATREEPAFCSRQEFQTTC